MKMLDFTRLENAEVAAFIDFYRAAPANVREVYGINAREACLCHSLDKFSQKGKFGWGSPLQRLSGFPDNRSVSCYLQEEFYLRQVFLEGEPEKDVMVILLRRDLELAGMLSLERDSYNLTLYGGLGVVAPKHRGTRLANIAPTCLEAMGRAMGMEVVYYITTLRSPHMQAVAETAGFRLVGILPGSDRAMVVPGVVKRVYEAVYIKVLVPDADLLRPKPEYLTARTRALFDVLFPE